MKIISWQERVGKLIKGMLNVGNLHISNGAMESFSCQEGGENF